VSTYTIEKVLWEFAGNPERVQRFKSDPDAYLASYTFLEKDEVEILKNMDVKQMAGRGVSTLLTMMVWQEMEGPQGVPAYMMRMNS
jgi:hypothetical protein